MYAIIKSYDKDINTFFFFAEIARLSIPIQQVLVFCSKNTREGVECVPLGWG